MHIIHSHYFICEGNHSGKETDQTSKQNPASCWQISSNGKFYIPQVFSPKTSPWKKRDCFSFSKRDPSLSSLLWARLWALPPDWQQVYAACTARNAATRSLDLFIFHAKIEGFNSKGRLRAIQVENSYRLHWLSADTNVRHRGHCGCAPLSSLLLFSLSCQLQWVPEHLSVVAITAPDVLNNTADVVSKFLSPFGNIFFLLMSTLSSYICLSLCLKEAFIATASRIMDLKCQIRLQHCNELFPSVPY